jgi:hypothetical protein
MRASVVTLVAVLGLVSGCGKRDDYGPTIEAFTGKITHKGATVKFPEGDTVLLNLRFIQGKDEKQQKGEQFAVPVSCSDGSFQIKQMPIGKYIAILTRSKPPRKVGERSETSQYNIPDGLTIEEGKTQYSIELGANWKL